MLCILSFLKFAGGRGSDILLHKIVIDVNVLQTYIKYIKNSLCIDHIYVQLKNNFCLILVLIGNNTDCSEHPAKYLQPSLCFAQVLHTWKEEGSLRN